MVWINVPPGPRHDMKARAIPVRVSMPTTSSSTARLSPCIADPPTSCTVPSVHGDAYVAWIQLTPARRSGGVVVVAAMLVGSAVLVAAEVVVVVVGGAMVVVEGDALAAAVNVTETVGAAKTMANSDLDLTSQRD